MPGADESPRITPNFTWREFEFSDTAVRHGIDNTVPGALRPAVIQLCEHVLEPARAALGPIRINSGYRAPRVNNLVGGSFHSQHMKGEAADITPLATSLRELYSWLFKNTRVDQLIFEFGAWIHVSYIGLTGRGEALVSERDPALGYVTYRTAEPRDGLLTV